MATKMKSGGTGWSAPGRHRATSRTHPYVQAISLPQRCSGFKYHNRKVDQSQKSKDNAQPLLPPCRGLGLRALSPEQLLHGWSSGPIAQEGTGAAGPKDAQSQVLNVEEGGLGGKGSSQMFTALGWTVTLEGQTDSIQLKL
jgi:hypothetical protein